MGKIKAIVFDLDNTLFDTDAQCVDRALRYAVGEMIKAGLPCDEEEGFRILRRTLASNPKEDQFRALVNRFELGDEVYKAGHEAYYTAPLNGLSLFKGVKELLENLRAEYTLALITFGDKDQQLRKIELLGITELFDKIIVTQVEDKESAFLDLVDELGIVQNRILVVGDRVDAELRIGNKIGMRTVRILQGKYASIKPSSNLDTPDFSLRTVTSLPEVLNEVNNTEDKLAKGPRVTLIGAGTGVPALVEGLKKYSHNLSCVINIIDEGRSSGVLRKELGMPPPGDIRNNLVALSDAQQLLYDLFQYRFMQGSLKGHSFGNLFLAALTKVTGNFQTAIREAAKILNLKGEVFPASLDDVRVACRLEDGTILHGEQEIVVKGDRIHSINRAPIQEVFLEPAEATANPAACEAILTAQVVVIGPGSLFTSIIPNLLLPDVRNALRNTKAKIIYVCNIMTQPGQTNGFFASDHLKHIIKYVGKGVIDYVILNSEVPEQSLLKQYAADKAFLVKNDIDEVRKLGVQPVLEDLVEDIHEKKLLWEKVSLLRHDSNKVAETIMGLLH